MSRENARLAAAEVATVIAYMGLMLVFCLLGCLLPMQRALRVQPTEALRGEQVVRYRLFAYFNSSSVYPAFS